MRSTIEYVKPNGNISCTLNGETSSASTDDGVRRKFIFEEQRVILKFDWKYQVRQGGGAHEELEFYLGLPNHLQTYFAPTIAAGSLLRQWDEDNPPEMWTLQELIPGANVFNGVSQYNEDSRIHPEARVSYPDATPFGVGDKWQLLNEMIYEAGIATADWSPRQCGLLPNGELIIYDYSLWTLPS